MEDILTDLLKVNVLLAFFTLFYWLFLRKETFFKLIRYYFIGSILTAFALPYFYTYKTIEIVREESIYEDPIISELSQVGTKEAPTYYFTLENILIALYLIGILWMLFRLFKSLYVLLRVIKYSKKTPIDSNVLHNEKINNAFSFAKWIVLPAHYTEIKDLDTIVTHEKIHIRQRHSIDILLIEIIHCFFWINPVIHLMKKNIRLNLEYLVDDEVTKKTSSYNYQKTLLSTLTITTNRLATSFNATELKKRIIMLNTQKSKNMKKLKITLTLPFMALFFFSFQVKTIAQIIVLEKTEQTQPTTQSTMSFYLYADNTKEEYKKMEKLLKKMYKIEATFSNIQRIDNKIVSFDVNVKNGKDQYTHSFGKKSPFHSLELIVENKGDKKHTLLLKESNDQMTAYSSEKQSQNNQLFVYEKEPKNHVLIVENTDHSTNDQANTLVEILNGETTVFLPEQAVYFINGKKATEEEYNKIAPTDIELIEITGKNNHPQNSIEEKRGIIKITTKKNAEVNNKISVQIKNRRERIAPTEQTLVIQKKAMEESLAMKDRQIAIKDQIVAMKDQEIAMRDQLVAMKDIQVALNDKRMEVALKMTEKYTERHQKKIEAAKKMIEKRNAEIKERITEKN